MNKAHKASRAKLVLRASLVFQVHLDPQARKDSKGSRVFRGFKALLEP